tara:strand:+ start:502 stop:687 length:186 start_codon:yes stop_codon:yes gene_type:complete
MESQVITIGGEEDLTIKATYDDLEEYSAFIYWMIDCGVTITKAEGDEYSETWYVGPNGLEE